MKKLIRQNRFLRSSIPRLFFFFENTQEQGAHQRAVKRAVDWFGGYHTRSRHTAHVIPVYPAADSAEQYAD